VGGGGKRRRSRRTNYNRIIQTLLSQIAILSTRLLIAESKKKKCKIVFSSPVIKYNV
jgi:hypothetical protein